METQLQASRKQLADRFRSLIEHKEDFIMNEEMQCITILMHLTDRTNIENFKKYDGLSDNEVITELVQFIEEENKEFKRIAQTNNNGSHDEWSRKLAIKHLRLNNQIQRLLNKYFGHN